ncbi:actin depolymerizing protein [Serendipita vermifera]|nr:actin depolymerizing protein [Serendipita vermifera]
MASGVLLSQEGQNAFKAVQMKQKGVKHKYITLKLINVERGSVDPPTIIVDKVVEEGSPEANYESFLDTLPEEDARWAVYDFDFDLGDAGKRSKLILFSWCPDSTKMRVKMVFASSARALQDLDVSVRIQASTWEEVQYTTVEGSVKGATR